MEWVSMYSQELDPTVRYSIEPSDVAIVEGLYLMRPELVPFFDFLIWLVIPPALVTERALIRDVPRLGDEAFVRKSYELQSIPAYRLYENLCKPALRADIVIDNSSATEPRVVRRNEHSQRQQSS
jgi:uridine kinase